MQIQLKERPVMDLNSGIIETYEVVKKSLDEQLHQTYLVDFFRILGLNGNNLKLPYILQKTPINGRISLLEHTQVSKTALAYQDQQLQLL